MLLNRSLPPTRRLTLTALLAALALVLSALEGMLPPLPWMPPGAKPGLSNLSTMYDAGTLGLLPALGIVLVKALFAGMTRGFTALLLSLAGGTLSTLVVWLLLRKRSPHGTVGLGILGALSHNLAQLAAAMLILDTTMLAYLPWLCLFALLTGSLTGILLRLLYPLFQKIHQ